MEDLKTILSAHFSPKHIVIAERFKFFKTAQEATEPVAQFIVRLKAAAKFCEFGHFLEEALRDRFVCGLAKKTSGGRSFNIF